jgi:hypothetical protein
VNCSRDQFFVSACFALDQYSELSAGCDPDPFLDLAHTRAGSNQAVAGREKVTPGVICDSSSFSKNPLEIGTPDGFCEMIKCSQSDGFDSVRAIGKSGKHNHGDYGLCFAQKFDSPETRPNLWTNMSPSQPNSSANHSKKHPTRVEFRLLGSKQNEANPSRRGSIPTSRKCSHRITRRRSTAAVDCPN